MLINVLMRNIFVKLDSLTNIYFENEFKYLLIDFIYLERKAFQKNYIDDVACAFKTKNKSSIRKSNKIMYVNIFFQ